MKEKTKSVQIKSVNRKDTYTLVKTQFGGLTYIAVKKNNTHFIKCFPDEFEKFRKLVNSEISIE